GKIAEPVLCFLVIGPDKPVEVYVEKGKITVKGDKNKPDDFKVEGSTAHQDFTEFTGAFVPVAKQLNALGTTINNTMPGKEREDMMVTYKSLQQSLQNVIDQFIDKKKNSPVSAFLLSATYQFNEDPILLEKRFNKLSA